MKKLLLTAALAAAALGVSAQNWVVNNPDNQPYLGIRAMLDVTCPGDLKVGDSKTSVLKNGAGVGIGLVYNQPIVANLYVEPGLELYYNTYGIKPEVLSPVVEREMEHSSLRKFGMRIPVQFGYHFDFTPDFSLGIFTGPVLNVGFSNDYYLTTKEVAGVRYHASGTAYKKGMLNRVDCDWRVGVAFNVQRLTFSVSGDFGIVNMLRHNNHGENSMFDRAVHVGVGYNF